MVLKEKVEIFTHNHDMLAVVFRSDSKRIACTKADGHVHLWDTIQGVEVASLAGRGDNKGDRLMGDGRTMENSSAGKAFIGWSYFVNGYRIFAGDSSKDICTLNVSEQVGFIFSALRVVRLCLYIYIYIYI